jgi:hypothetical protein
MPVIAIEAAVKLAMMFLQWLIMKKINDKELKVAFVQFAELARSENIKTILARQNSEQQLKAASDKWDEIEEKEREQEKTLEGRKS